jgi:hypothetical protein
MKKINLLLMLTLLMSGTLAFTQENMKKGELSTSKNESSIEWISTEYDFEEVETNKTVEAIFEFTNTGKTPVIITKVAPSCGCTGTKYSKEPVNPGEKATIKVNYRSSHAGNFNKSIRVTTTADVIPTTLRVKGKVIKP